MCFGHPRSVPLMKVEDCFISLPIQSTLFSTYLHVERAMDNIDRRSSYLPSSLRCNVRLALHYQHCIAISTLPNTCTTLQAALTTHIRYVYSTYNYLSGTCRPKISYAAHVPHIMLVGFVSRPWCSGQWSRLHVYVCGEVRQC